VDVAAFVATVVWATIGGWQARDIVWALWVSSLVVGYATIVTSIVRGVRENKKGLGVLAVLGGVGLLTFFTFHFGMFHFVHGVFLNMFFPLVEDGKTPGSILAFGVAALANYWPFVLFTLVSRIDDVGGPGGVRSGSDGMTAPYKNVVRMHLLIFIFAGLHAAGLTRFAIYPVLAAYFFPWGALSRQARAASAERRSRQAA